MYLDGCLSVRVELSLASALTVVDDYRSIEERSKAK